MTEKKRLRRGERAARIAAGLCPKCGKEAAPFLLCWGCRLEPRLDRSLKRGVKAGAIVQLPGDFFKLPAGGHDPKAERDWDKWSTPINLDENDGRGKPRLRGIRVDVTGTLLEVMKHIGRPCKIEEIMAAWGRLRAKRVDPLAGDLGRLIVADEKRARKLAKRAALAPAGATP